MKRILAAALLTAGISAVSAQDYNKWSVGLDFGVHDAVHPSAGITRMYQFQHVGLNGRYMFNNRFGVMLDGAYDLFDFVDYGKNTNYYRIGIQGVANLGDMMNFGAWTNRIGLLAHAGFGFGGQWQKGLELNNRFLKNSDDVGNLLIGITPQVRLNDRVALHLDLTYVGNYAQDYTFDMGSRIDTKGVNAGFVNLSIGANFYLGKNKTHADWTPTVYGSDNSGLESRLKAIEEQNKALEEKTKDDDNDGVPNYLDEETNTPAGSYVDSKGKAIKNTDSDGDGINDAYDACPNQKGSFSTNGCPDSDGDGIADPYDNCPNVYGTLLNKGCPEVKEQTRKIMEKALKGVQFETGKAVLKPVSYSVLDEVVKEMKNNPEYKLNIDGHTDNEGTDEYNLKLSQERADAVKAYLVSKGVSADRLKATGYGKTRPKASNDTAEGRAINRRVELNVVY